VLDLWRAWWIGDTVHNVFPLKHLTLGDVKHLDKLPITDDELHARTGANSDKRRPTRKLLYEMRWLMKYMEAKVEERNVFPREITHVTVEKMFADICDILPKNR
jgi:hypothetical protein